MLLTILRAKEVDVEDVARPRVRGLRHTGRLHRYTEADTWYLAWGPDGDLWSPYADGVVDGQRVVSTWSDDGFWFGPLGQGAGLPGTVTTGWARVTGGAPDELRVSPVGVLEHRSPRWHGVYPCASLVTESAWFSGTYSVHRWRDPAGRPVTYELGPFRGFDVSTDGGRTWRPTPWADPRSMLGETGRPAGGPPVRFGAPRVVDHGRANEHAPDGKAYLLGHGTSDPGGVATWASGDEIVLARVDPDPEAVNDPDAWEFCAGPGRWVSRLADAAPVLRSPGRCGIVSATWVPALRQYLLFTCGAPADGGFGPYDTWVCSAPDLTGPWETVTVLEAFGSQGYFVNAPSRFLSDDGSRLWLSWSANWDSGLGGPSFPDPPRSGYGLCLGEFELELER